MAAYTDEASGVHLLRKAAHHVKCISVANWVGPTAGGYGTSAEKLLFALSRRTDVIARLVPLSHDGWELVRPEVRALADVEVEADVQIHFGVPSDRECYRGKVALTMTEGTDLPETWVDALNEALLVLVPSHWVKTVFEAAGVTTPVEVVPFGIEQGPPARVRPRPERFTFLAIDKGPGLARDAFVAEFAEDEPVRLILKARRKFPDEWPHDPRITLIADHYTQTQMRGLYLQASCFVHLPEGSGWALPVSEAVGLGVPVVVPVHTGMREYLHESYVVPVGTYHAVATDPLKGLKCQFRLEDIAWSMRHAYEMGDDLVALAEKAQRFTRHFTWERSAQLLVDALTKHGLL